MGMLHTFKIILFEVQLPLGTVHLIYNLLGGKLNNRKSLMSYLFKKVLGKRQLPKYR